MSADNRVRETRHERGGRSAFAKSVLTVLIIQGLMAASIGYAGEEVAVRSKNGRFKVTQEYRGDYAEIVRFRDPKLPPVQLTGFNWPAMYYVSSDENWLLRDQNTGSGDSIAMLYRVEANGRVSEVQGFDDLLWRISDQTARLKKKDLYHTGASRVAWSKDSGSLEIVLRGSNVAKSGDGIETRLIYHLSANKVMIGHDDSEQGGAPPR